MRRTRAIPEAFAATLRNLREQGERDRLNALLSLLHSAGWTYAEIGKALGISWQGVQSRVTYACPCDGLPDIPLPEPHPKSKRARRRERVQAVRDAKPKMTGDLAARLREMYAVAATLRGPVPADHPARRASEDFTALLANLRDDGYNMHEIARILGVRYDTVRSRLGRHGYKHQPPSQPRYKGAGAGRP